MPTSAPTRCANCAHDFTSAPLWLGKRLAVCTAHCLAELAIRETPRLEAWLSLIVVKSRGKGRDLASSGLYSNVHPSKAFGKVRL